MTSIANHDDVAYWDYTGVRQFLVSLSIVSHQLKDIPMVQHALKNLNWRFPRSLKQLQIYLFPTAVFFLVGCWNKCGLWEIWNCFLTLLHQEQNDCHLKIVYQSYEDLFQVFLWSTSIQTKHQFQICLVFFLTHVYLLDPLKLSLRCKRDIVSFILMLVELTILPMISLSNYKWKVCSMFSVLFALEFGAR